MKWTLSLLVLINTTNILARKESDTLHLLTYNEIISADYISYLENGYRIYFPFSAFEEYVTNEITKENNPTYRTQAESLIAKIQTRLYLFGTKECFDLKYLEQFEGLITARPKLSPVWVSFTIVQSGKSIIQDPTGNFLRQVIIVNKSKTRKEKYELRATNDDLILGIEQRITSP